MEIFANEALGFDGILVQVEADIRTGIPAVEIVGLASTSVREARERARIAVRNAGFQFPQDRILVNLSPADVQKEGSAYDLPIALRILASSGQIQDLPSALLAMGELTLEGELRPVRGILPAVRAAVEHGIHICLIPEENADEAEIVGAAQVWPLRHLSEVRAICDSIARGEMPSSRARGKSEHLAGSGLARGSAVTRASERRGEGALDFSDFRGEPGLMRALTIAAVGGHNLFLSGPPGAGKTMAAQRFPSILPFLTEEQALESTSLHSLWGTMQTRLLNEPPFRAPHHSATLEGMIGGGRPPRPGEVSLAHHGVLFLDECPEFHRDVLQALREPAERGYVDIVRAGRTLRFPSRFQLLMAANPCPCGNLGMPGKTCLCSAEEIRKYWKKLGGPLLDRLDMRIAMRPADARQLVGGEAVSSAALRGAVTEARARQRRRLSKCGLSASGGRPCLDCGLNARIPPALITGLCSLSSDAERSFSSAVASFGLSARAIHSVLRIALSIADLDGRDAVGSEEIDEALGYRQFGDSDAVWPR